MEIMRASQEWRSRPDDQRYLSLDEVKIAVAKRRGESWTATPKTNELTVRANADGVALELYDPTKGEQRQIVPSNWSFGQLAQYAKAPAAYLRSLPPELAAINLQWGLERNPMREDTLVLAQSNGDNRLRAMTSTSYGRIWDSQVVDAVIKANASGRWEVPAASYATTNPKRATTLYASDRDIFLFLVDPKNPVTVGKEELFRGFYTWNSEVGAATFGLTTFLYRYVCDNRIIWGASNVQELRIRHTGGAPERFGYQGEKYLARYAEESTKQLVDGIKAAQAKEIPLNVNHGDTVASWLTARGFTKAQATASVETAVAEEGQARSLWDVVNGVTAYARSVSHTDERIDLETKAGKLMQLVA